MKIGVLLKQVPDTETKIRLKPDGSGIDEGGIKWIVNPYDEFAVEEALRLKEKSVGSEVVIVNAGPARAVEAIRTALAMGADRGIRIDCDGMAPDSYLTAKMLSAVIKEEGFDVVFAGKQAVDDDCAQTVQMAAEFSDMPSVLPIEKFELRPDGKGAVVERPVGGGIKEVIDVNFPAVFGCEKGLNTPRYASLPGIMKAKTKPIADKKGADIVQGDAQKTSVLGWSLPPERSAGRKIDGEPEVVAEQLVRFLREEAKAI